MILGTEYTEARALCAGLVEELDRSLAENSLELPSLPEVALKIRKALADENVSVTEISRLIGSDPALAARILKTSNSALFYRGSKPITSVHAAVSQLGHRMVRNVALSFAAQQVFIGYGSQQLRNYLTQIWQHSVHVAALAHMLARVRTKLNPDEAFLAGLLHEVGKLYILMRAKEKLDVLASENAFQAVLAAWHPRLGRAVIELWQLPAELAVAVGDHQSCKLEAPEPPTHDGDRGRRELPRGAQRGSRQRRAVLRQSAESRVARDGQGHVRLADPRRRRGYPPADARVRRLTTPRPRGAGSTVRLPYPTVRRARAAHFFGGNKQ